MHNSGTAKHASFGEEEARKARQQLCLAKASKEGHITEHVVADPKVGEEANPILREFSELHGAYQESENPEALAPTSSTPFSFGGSASPPPQQLAPNPFM
ncbi:hypothetical protein EI94DRAFT_1804048 [Lactarius quietus]|nr:hypothetical protein EI94DRAFT_1804048 [Lactarius quietus]